MVKRESMITITTCISNEFTLLQTQTDQVIYTSLGRCIKILNSVLHSQKNQSSLLVLDSEDSVTARASSMVPEVTGR